MIGITLGLLGSGGSILTVPVLVYLLGHVEKVAIAESLAIVGGIALLTVIPYARSGQVDWPSVVFFGVPGMAGTYLGAWLARFLPGAVQLLIFALVMLLAAWTMLRHTRTSKSRDGAEDETNDSINHARWLVAVEGLVVGVVTGLVGVGGGFLIVPALVVLGGLPMRLAIGTSLAVIALKSASGLFKYLDVLRSLELAIDWRTVGAFVLVGVIGSVAGHLIGGRLNQRALRQGFAVFLVAMGLFVLSREVPRLAVSEASDSSASVAAELESVRASK